MFNSASLSHWSKQRLIGTLFLPWLLAEVLQYNPLASYIIAWLGSFFIFYCSLLSPIRYLPQDLPLFRQVMRPIVLIQIIFAGFMCSTSIFYFLNHIGYQYFIDVNVKNFLVNEQTSTLAACQRYALLGHAALVTGMLVNTKLTLTYTYRFSKNVDELLIPICLMSMLLAFLMNKVGTLSQFGIMFSILAQFTGTYAFIKGIRYHQFSMIIVGGTIFSFYLFAATLSGYKERLIINVLLFTFLLFPYYKKVVSICILPVIGLLLYVLPTLSSVIRQEVWSGNSTTETARKEVYETLLSKDPLSGIQANNWEFLTNRLSEIGMFVEFVDYVPQRHPYYGFEIIENSVPALIPRAIWRHKKSTEEISMQRVYDAGVVSRLSSVSAKTRPVVDGYLSAGAAGIFIALFCYGMIAQWLCNQAEKYFGGYEFGCVIIFNGIFQQLWRGNNFEFLLNNIFYGYLLMMILFFILRVHRVLIPAYHSQNATWA